MDATKGTYQVRLNGRVVEAFSFSYDNTLPLPSNKSWEAARYKAFEYAESAKRRLPHFKVTITHIRESFVAEIP